MVMLAGSSMYGIGVGPNARRYQGAGLVALD